MLKGIPSMTAACAAGLCFSAAAMAAPQTTLVPIHLNNSHKVKMVSLMKITPSAKAAKQLAQNVQFVLANPHYGEVHNGSDPEEKYVGMHGLPVLDQGMHGSCATFASTAGVDTVFPLESGQTVSQLCNLELGKTLNQVQGGGWDGSFGYLVLGQVQDHGFLTMDYQKKNGCGGLTEYPVNSFNTGSAMPTNTFEKDSNKNFTSADWKTLWKYNGQFAPIDPTDGAKILVKVKHALNNGHVVVFGTVLNQYQGQAGAVGTYNGASNDTWVLTSQSTSINAGHEMVIDGYDDNACATFNGSEKQCGLLHLRNSWGQGAGDHGDYYMSYDFFKTMAIEDYELGKGVNQG